MSAQVVPITTFDGCGEPPMQNGNNGSSTTSSSNTTTESRSTKKHVYSRFLKKRPPDLYGQRHAIETDKCVNDSLRLLEKELQKIPNVKRSGLEQASVICPEIYESKEHRLLFLRCEQFNADVSAHIHMMRLSQAANNTDFTLHHSSIYHSHSHVTPS